MTAPQAHFGSCFWLSVAWKTTRLRNAEYNPNFHAEESTTIVERSVCTKQSKATVGLGLGTSFFNVRPMWMSKKSKTISAQAGMMITFVSLVPYSARVLEQLDCSFPPFGVPVRHTSRDGWQHFSWSPFPHVAFSNPLLSAAPNFAAPDTGEDRKPVKMARTSTAFMFLEVARV